MGEQLRETASTVAMTVALISGSMLFGALVLGYGILRFNAPLWPPMGAPGVNLFYPILSTTLIALSSMAYGRFEWGCRRGFYRKELLGLALLSGVGFLISQTLLWKGLGGMTGIFASLIYGLTWIHGGHLVFGLLFLVWTFVLGSSSVSRLWVKNVGLFWHFLGVIWFVLYGLLFIV